MTTTRPNLTPRSGTAPAIAAILAISAAATLFLFWLIYIHPAAASSTQFAFLPALNAIRRTIIFMIALHPRAPTRLRTVRKGNASTG